MDGWKMEKEKVLYNCVQLMSETTSTVYITVLYNKYRKLMVLVKKVKLSQKAIFSVPPQKKMPIVNIFGCGFTPLK
jgi:hypothetical protein